MNDRPSRPRWTPERLAYWYFRLNGFLTIENFVVHPDEGRSQRTDADLLAVRFAHRAENLVRPMRDDPRVADCATFANVIIAEIKTGRCALNGPWTDPFRQNMERVLKAIGCVPDSVLGAAASALYTRGAWTDTNVTIRLFALGETPNSDLMIPDSQQITWDEVIDFCIQRFREYGGPKSSVGQWASDGRWLAKTLWRRDAKERIRQNFGLRSS